MAAGENGSVLMYDGGSDDTIDWSGCAFPTRQSTWKCARRRLTMSALFAGAPGPRANGQMDFDVCFG